jgi:hypothetical protein
MNYGVYKQIIDRLKVVDSLKWSDLDSGQIDMQNERPAVKFPACLIDIAYPRCEEVASFIQNVTALITLRVVFSFTGASHSRTPETALAATEAMFATLEEIHDALQGWGSASLSRFTRISAMPEKRRDGLKVYKIVYETGFEETSFLTPEPIVPEPEPEPEPEPDPEPEPEPDPV